MVPSQVDTPVVGGLIAGKYQLEQLIGEGGQAWIWKAIHLELGSEVALKILRFSATESTQTERLRTEARAVAKLNHPAIVRVFDLGQTEHGNPYFAMEHLDGENLADSLVRTGRLPPIEAVRLLLPIAGAVAAAHAIGVVHRDLKPDNVFLARTGHSVQPKLLDFGVAKYDLAECGPRNLTLVGTVLGSPSYLSPEQARGQTDIDTRADIWSFCTMLYECVTGTVPFVAENTHALLFSIAEDAPHTLEEHGVDEPELWEILLRGLEKSPCERWPNMRSLGRALAQWLADRGVTSDITGVTLDTVWLNPEIVTQPEQPVPDAPCSGRRVVDSHIESLRPSQPRNYRPFVMGAVVALLCVGGATLLTKLVDGSFQSLEPSLLQGRPLKQFGPAPLQLRVEYPERLATIRPSSLGNLAPAPPAVPVEKLKLVGSNVTQPVRASIVTLESSHQPSKALTEALRLHSQADLPSAAPSPTNTSVTP